MAALTPGSSSTFTRWLPPASLALSSVSCVLRLLHSGNPPPCQHHWCPLHAGIVCWVFLMLFFLVRFCYCCCKRPCCPYPRKNVTRGKKIGLNVAITIIFLAAIAGAAQVWAGGPMTATQVGNLVDLLIGKVNSLINTVTTLINSVTAIAKLISNTSTISTSSLSSTLTQLQSVQNTVNNVNSKITSALDKMKTASIAVAAGFAGLLIVFYIILVIWRGACWSFFSSPGWYCRVKNESRRLQAAAGLASPWPSCPGC